MAAKPQFDHKNWRSPKGSGAPQAGCGGVSRSEGFLRRPRHALAATALGDGIPGNYLGDVGLAAMGGGIAHPCSGPVGMDIRR